MNPRFEVNDKVIDPATNRAGYVSGVRYTSNGYNYDITWLAPSLQWGSYKEWMAETFHRVDTSWNRLMSPDPF
jgi:hypothetical protein